MYSRTLLLSVLISLISFVSATAHETNADRMRRGLNPLAPRRLHNPIHAARTAPSSVSCPSNALSGYIVLRGNGGNHLGYLSNDGSTCTKSPQKYEYPSGCDTHTALKISGTNNYIGAYARSIVGSVISDLKNLFAALKSRTNGCSFTSTKVVPNILAGKTLFGSNTCQTQVFKVASKDHCITQSWKDDGHETNLQPIGCYSSGRGSVSVHWVENPHGLSAGAMSSICPGGIEVDVILRFECAL